MGLSESVRRIGVEPKQYLVRQQPCHGSLEQDAGPLRSRPAECVQPATQSKADRRFGDFDEAVLTTDIALMIPPEFTCPVVVEGGIRVRNIQLPGNGG